MLNEFREAVEKAASKAGFSYSRVEIGVHGSNGFSASFMTVIGGKETLCGVTTGGTVSAKRTVDGLAMIAVARCAEWVERCKEEAREDLIVSQGGAPFLNPRERATKPGHWI